MKNIKHFITSALFIVLLSSCELSQLSDPNNPSVDLVNNASLSELQNLVVGIESGMRNDLGNYYDNVNMIGREYWRFSGSDPRFTADLLGKGTAVLDNNTFYITNPYGSRYRVIKNTNLLIEALEKTQAAISANQKTNALGFAQTIQAYQLLLALNLLHENGIRTDVKDFDNLGAFRSRTEALSDIAALLNQGYTNLTTGTEETFFFSSNLSPALGFYSPESFAEFNRGLAARVAIYRGNYAEALTFLDNSFLNFGGNLDAGAYHFFSISGGDITNVLYFPRNASSEARIVHPNFIASAEAGDLRVSKRTALRDDGDDAGTDPDPATQDGLSGIYDYWAYRTPSDFIPIMRNEELMLIYAEAKIQTNSLTDGTDALNIVRNAAGLSDLANNLTQAQLITAMLKERRYSLFGEGHRWIDMRRYNRLGELTLDRDGDDVWIQFPRPANDTE